MIGDILISLFFLVGGLVFLFLVLTKYTEEAHRKEMEKNKKQKKDYYNYENALFSRFMSSSYWIAKGALLLCAGGISVIGVLLLWLKIR